MTNPAPDSHVPAGVVAIPRVRRCVVAPAGDKGFGGANKKESFTGEWVGYPSTLLVPTPLGAHEPSPPRRPHRTLSATKSADIVMEEKRAEMKAAQEPKGDGVAFEDAMNAKKKDRRKAKVQVNAPVVDQVYGNKPKTVQNQAEEAYVSVLGFLGLVIIVMGVFLAGSGFLSEEADAFGQDFVYPAFSPTVGIFLAGSTAYGIWKNKDEQ